MTRGKDLPHINNVGVGTRRGITHIHLFATSTDVSILFLDADDAGVAFWSVRTEDPRSRWALLDDAQTLYRFAVGPRSHEIDDQGAEYEVFPVRWLSR